MPVLPCFHLDKRDAGWTRGVPSAAWLRRAVPSVTLGWAGRAEAARAHAAGCSAEPGSAGRAPVW
eukprot:12320106-Alexandrium_andersonii.AAC.1